MKNALTQLEKIAIETDHGFTHFLYDTTVVVSTVSGLSRISNDPISANSLIAIIAGLIVDVSDDYIAMPLAFGLYLHQVSNVHKGTVNHNCAPNCKIVGFNKLIAKRDINIGEELTIDYGTTVVGNGFTIISDCKCGSSNCRGQIRSSDYKILPYDELCLVAQYTLNQMNK